MTELLCTIERHQGFFNLLLTGALAVATVFLGWVTRKLWVTTKDLWLTSREAAREARRASQGTILLEANRDLFFNDRMYRVRKAIEDEKPIFKEKGGECTEQDVEDYIGYCEMLYGFMEHGILDVKLTDDYFGGYVEEASINEEIREYIAYLRRKMNEDELYEGFEQ